MFRKRLYTTLRARADIWRVLAVSIVVAAHNTSSGGILFFDDFETLPSNPGNLSISDDHARTEFTRIGAENGLTDISVQTQLRVTEGSIGAIIRWDVRQPAPNGYYGLIRADGTAQLGWVGGDWPVLREAVTGLNAADCDILMQLEAMGNQIDFWIWSVDQSMPDMPTLSIVDDTVAAGSVALGGISAEYPIRGFVEGVFRYVLVADVHVPEPAISVLAAIASGTAMLIRRGGVLRQQI
jgi:hypothetical protein